MLARRAWMHLGIGSVVTAAGIMGPLPCALPSPAAVQSRQEPKVNKERLREQLEKGLRATRDNEVKYVGQIACLVANGVIELRLVTAVFRWARRKHPEYPYIYFRRALAELAKREEVDIDEEIKKLEAEDRQALR